jgi:hypothetical protein
VKLINFSENWFRHYFIKSLFYRITFSISFLGQSYGNNVYEFSYQQTGSSSYSPSDDVTYNLAQPFLHDVTKSDDVTNGNDNDDSLTTRSSLSNSGGDALSNEHTEFYPMGPEQTLGDSQIVLIPQDFSQSHVYTSLPNKSA